MSMTESEFKNEVYRRGELQRAKNRRNKKIILSIIPAFVLTSAIIGAVSFLDLGNIITTRNKSALSPTIDLVADEERAEGYVEYSTTISENALIAHSDTVNNNGTTSKRATVTAQNGESVLHIIGEKQVKEITDAVNELISYSSTTVTDDNITQYEASVKPDYTVTITDEQGNEKVYYIIKNTFTDGEKAILCDDEQKVKELIDLIK